MISVYPSGVACAAFVLPSVPPAPVTFSTTTCWPSVRDMCSPTMRATTSVGPPAANGTMRVIGRSGYAALPWSGRAAYPERPITLIVPFAAGGPTDVVARIVGEHMSRTLGQQVVVENVTGAGGTLGSTKAAQATPDGYT